MEVKEGNEVIARWMGLESYQDSRYGKLWPDPLGTHHTEFSLQYNTDWRWLMPVWYKFRDLRLEGENDLILDAFKASVIGKIAYGDSPERAFNELVKAINWYQNLKQ
jgi:hypothetical protein